LHCSRDWRLLGRKSTEATTLKQRRSDRGRKKIPLPQTSLRRFVALRALGGEKSADVGIDEAPEVCARLLHAREIEAFEKLTPRLQEVLRMIADGLSTKEIAAQLNIANKTVEFHRGRLTKQLGMRATAILARYAVRVGAIVP
jgi:DNA-binding NarL/FixJ family response regulator